MGCCGSDRKKEVVLNEHKFAYINLADFRSSSALNWIAYIGIYLGSLISITCYAADIYTAVILLGFDRWTNSLKQTSLIDFHTVKIVFVVCIFLSFVLIAIDWFFAIKVIRSDGVAQAYMNVIAVRYNCIRGGSGKGDTGWKRFLVFSRLTKSRGLVDYIALFTYFAFKGWVRIIIAEGPRVAINTLTFISVTQADDIVKNQSDALGVMERFFENIKGLYAINKVQVIVLGTMAFTTIMWIFAILRLLLASILYVCFLWHAMSGSGSLRTYCKDRIDTRMGEIVQKKHDKALAREKKKQPDLLRQPTIPLIGMDLKHKPSASSSDAGSMSSTANLLANNPSPPQSTIYAPSLRREPTLPNISEFDRPSTTAEVVKAYSDERNYPMQTIPRPAVGPVDRTGTAPPRFGDGGYGPQNPVPPRSATAGPGGRGDQEGFMPPPPPLRGPGSGYGTLPLRGPGSGYGTPPPPRAATAGPGNGAYRPPRGPPRAATADPYGQQQRAAAAPYPEDDCFPQRQGNEYQAYPGNTQVPPWAATAGPENGRYRTPPPERNEYQAYPGNRQVPLPRAATAGPENGRYGTPPPRATPERGGYGTPPPERNEYQPYPGNNTQQLPPRSASTAPDRAYGTPPPPRAATVAPERAYGIPPLPRAATAGPERAYGTPPPPRSATASPHGPPRRGPPPSDPYARGAY